jgi:hypothetical protein
VYRAADDGSQFLVPHGWTSAAQWQRFLQDHMPRILAAATERGATLEPFAGQTHADQYDPPGG